MGLQSGLLLPLRPFQRNALWARSGPTSAYDSAVLTDGPVAFWPMNETSGTSAIDKTGNGRTGTYTGGFTLAQSGPCSDGETSVAFNGSTGQMVLASAPVTGTPLSMEVWVNLASASLKGAAIKVGDSTGGIGLGIGNSTMDAAGNDAIVLFETVGWHPALVSLSTGWHMLALTYDTAGAGLVVYVDGSPVLTATDNNALAAANDTYVGGYGTRFLAANVAKAAIYNKALTAARIAAHYAAR